jgi:hypothetical protein
VRFARGTLTLISSTPADGYAAEVHDALAGDVEVRFRNPDHEWRILVRVDHGALAPEITEH